MSFLQHFENLEKTVIEHEFSHYQSLRGQKMGRMAILLKIILFYDVFKHLNTAAVKGFMSQISRKRL